MAGSVGVAAARFRIAEVQPGGSLRKHRRRCNLPARIEDERQRLSRRSRHAHIHRAEVLRFNRDLLHGSIQRICDKNIPVRVDRHARR